MRKEVDKRLQSLIDYNIRTRHRSLFIIVGDKATDQVVNLHQILSRLAVDQSLNLGGDSGNNMKPSVLWCYNKGLGFASHKKKRLKQIKKAMQQKAYDPNIDDAFDTFISTTSIRYCYYKETSSILGRTFGMLVLQDFESLTPNVMCRTIETVAGGGIVCLILNKMSSLRTLYTLAMSHHSKYEQNGRFGDLQPLFNKRLILSLANCPTCLVVDDELNVLPISKHMYHGLKKITKLNKSLKNNNSENSFNISLETNQTSLNNSGQTESISLEQIESDSLKFLEGKLLSMTATEDQGNVLKSVINLLASRSTNDIASITAGRGRGKSAALGLAIAAAISQTYTNVYVTAPQAENVQTLFHFIQKGLVAIGMTEHKDFELIQEKKTDNTENYNTNITRDIVRINVFREHRQTIQYMSPDAPQLSVAELLVIDEAAAIPLPTVKKMLGPYLTLISSTVNGYEGTGRSLSLKLLRSLKKGTMQQGQNTGKQFLCGKNVHEFTMEDPIRYAAGDPVERFLYKLLCLDACTPTPLSPSNNIVTPTACKLYLVNREALFSYHPVAEEFLHRLMSLFVGSHYKNSPNDLHMLADAPAHSIFVLTSPIDPAGTTLPDIYCAIQVCLEGAINQEIVAKCLGRGLRPSGDLVPWTLAQYFINEDFAQLTGVRIIRITTHNTLERMGYGKEAVRQLVAYYSTTFSDQGSLQTKILTSAPPSDITPTDTKTNRLHDEEINAPAQIPPLLCDSITYPNKHQVDYMGVCYGLTFDLYKFWNRLGFLPVYLRQTPNEITAEHSCIMLRAFSHSKSTHLSPYWLDPFISDFRSRFLSLLGVSYSHFSTTLALSIMNPRTATQSPENAAQSLKTAPPSLTYNNIENFFSPHDIRRIDQYAKQLADKGLIWDLLPRISWLFFTKRIPTLTLPFLQCAVLLALGSQNKSVEDLISEFKLESNQCLALLNKTLHRFAGSLKKIMEQDPEIAAVDHIGKKNSEGIGHGATSDKSLAEVQESDGQAVATELDGERKLLVDALKHDKVLKQYSFDKNAENQPESCSYNLFKKGNKRFKHTHTAQKTKKHRSA